MRRRAAGILLAAEIFFTAWPVWSAESSADCPTSNLGCLTLIRGIRSICGAYRLGQISPGDRSRQEPDGPDDYYRKMLAVANGIFKLKADDPLRIYYKAHNVTAGLSAYFDLKCALMNDSQNDCCKATKDRFPSRAALEDKGDERALKAFDAARYQAATQAAASLKDAFYCDSANADYARLYQAQASARRAAPRPVVVGAYAGGKTLGQLASAGGNVFYGQRKHPQGDLGDGLRNPQRQIPELQALMTSAMARHEHIGEVDQRIVQMAVDAFHGWPDPSKATPQVRVFISVAKQYLAGQRDFNEARLFAMRGDISGYNRSREKLSVGDRRMLDAVVAAATDRSGSPLKPGEVVRAGRIVRPGVAAQTNDVLCEAMRASWNNNVLILDATPLLASRGQERLVKAKAAAACFLGALKPVEQKSHPTYHASSLGNYVYDLLEMSQAAIRWVRLRAENGGYVVDVSGQEYRIAIVKPSKNDSGVFTLERLVGYLPRSQEYYGYLMDDWLVRAGKKAKISRRLKWQGQIDPGMGWAVEGVAIQDRDGTNWSYGRPVSAKFQPLQNEPSIFDAAASAVDQSFPFLRGISWASAKGYKQFISIIHEGIGKGTKDPAYVLCSLASRNGCVPGDHLCSWEHWIKIVDEQVMPHPDQVGLVFPYIMEIRRKRLEEDSRGRHMEWDSAKYQQYQDKLINAKPQTEEVALVLAQYFAAGQYGDLIGSWADKAEGWSRFWLNSASVAMSIGESQAESVLMIAMLGEVKALSVFNPAVEISRGLRAAQFTLKVTERGSNYTLTAQMLTSAPVEVEGLVTALRQNKIEDARRHLHACIGNALLLVQTRQVHQGQRVATPRTVALVESARNIARRLMGSRGELDAKSPPVGKPVGETAPIRDARNPLQKEALELDLRGIRDPKLQDRVRKVAAEMSVCR